MSRLTDLIFGTHSSHALKQITPQIDAILTLKQEMEPLSDLELQGKTDEFKKRFKQGETLEDLLPEAFAAMREADRRVLHMEPFPVQVTGGIILHQGRIAELKTGEGKTLTATLPVYLNALTGENVMVVTVNDYLAIRDAQELRPVYEFMGLTVSAIQNGMSQQERKEAYECNITYVTNSELGFDYLRDHIAKSKDDQVLRGLSYALIDEADSVLIDEARTPLIISGQGEKNEGLLAACAEFVRTLIHGGQAEEVSKLDLLSGNTGSEKGDFMTDRRDKTIYLTVQGLQKAETYFEVENLMDMECFSLNHMLQNALRAQWMMEKDRDYIVDNGEVKIVDEFTGRVLPGRRFSDGLHQALEAKEGVEIQPENTTLASITYQGFFNRFKKKSGMTGTGATAEREFRDVYGMDVVQVPTNRPLKRKDLNDYVYRTREEKIQAVIDEIIKTYKKRQPILVGTKDIQDSEELSRRLKKAGIPHLVLTAKQDKEEAQIVAQAGHEGAVTIATNMAGRGTDIKLTKEAKEAGGLYVIGTDRAESRRIDDQLVGRSGRQGDPGRSRFFLSLEDDLLRLFAPKHVMDALARLAGEEGKPLDSPLLSKAVCHAQENMEATHASQRLNVLKYDEIAGKQRDDIYGERDFVLNKEDISDKIIDMIRTEAGELSKGIENLKTLKERDCEARRRLSFLPHSPSWELSEPGRGGWEFRMQKEAFIQYMELSSQFDKKDVRDLEKWAVLTAVDSNWSSYLDELEYLKQDAGLCAYANQNPEETFKKASAEAFGRTLKNVRRDAAINLLSCLGSWEKQKKEQKKKKPVTVYTTLYGNKDPYSVQVETV